MTHAHASFLPSEASLDSHHGEITYHLSVAVAVRLPAHSTLDEDSSRR
jgi:hypothetical protein